MLLALAALARHPIRASNVDRSPPRVAVGLAVGALLPDASLFVMWGRAKLAGVPEERIWRELYYTDFWQTAGAMTNSAPLYAALALAAWLAGGRLAGEAARARALASVVLAAAAAALLHVATDLPLHHDDGHPHFWPFSDWIYVSPVSYWDSDHHGDVWRWIEGALAAVLIAVLWRHSRARWARALLVLAALAYGGALLYFTAAL